MFSKFSYLNYSRTTSNTTDYGKSMLWFVKLLLEAVFMWPDTKRPKLLILSSIIITFASVFTLCGLLSFIIVNIKDFNKATYGMCLLALPILSITKIPLICYRYKAIKTLLKQIETDFWPYDIVGLETKNELKGIYSFSIGFMVCFFIIGEIYYSAFLVLPVFLTERTLPFPCSLPFDLTNRWSFALIYIMQFICLQLGIAFAVVGIDLLTLSLCVCASNQYRILQKCFLIYNTDEMLQTNELLRVFKKESMKKYVLEKEYLVRLIDHHNLLLRFIRHLNEVLSPLELGHLAVSIMGICLGTFILSMKDPSTVNSILALIYFTGFNLQLAIDCTVGAELYHQATLLPECIFHSDWMLLKDDILKKDILFVLQISQRFPQFGAYNLYNLNMLTFVKVQRFAFSIYTLLSNISTITLK